MQWPVETRTTSHNISCPVPASPQSTVVVQVQLAERVSRDANVVQVYGAAVAEDAVLLVMELMQVRVEGSRCHFVYCKHHACSVAKYSTRSGTAVL